MSPLHHDPALDGSNWGCFTEKANAKVARLVSNIRESLQFDMYEDWDEVLADIKTGLRAAGSGATDTVVKESVFLNLEKDMRDAGLEPDSSGMYGW